MFSATKTPTYGRGLINAAAPPAPLPFSLASVMPVSPAPCPPGGAAGPRLRQWSSCLAQLSGFDLGIGSIEK